MPRQLISDQLEDYLRAFVPSRPAEMEAMEAYARRTGFPIIGPAAGYLCYQVSRMTGARSVFELGSGYGYSTAWFARAVEENGGGTVHYTDRSEELHQKARGHLSALGFADVVEYHVGEAVRSLRETEEPFDLIFIDIDKEDYPSAVPVIGEKLRPEGVLIADNVLWGGRIFDERDHSSSTEAIREFTGLILDDPAWIPMVVPIRDGLLIAYKRG